MLHDPNFFIFNDNPYGLPTATRVFDAGTMFSHYHRIALSEIQELDLPTDPCNNDQSYNFNSCVRRSLARQVKHRRWQSSIFYRWVARPYGTDGMDQEFPTVQLENNTGAKILGSSDKLFGKKRLFFQPPKKVMQQFFLGCTGPYYGPTNTNHAKNCQKTIFGALFRPPAQNALQRTTVQCNVL